MGARAIVKYVRMSPTGMGVILGLIGGKNIQETLAILQRTLEDAVVIINKILKSAVTNAENDHEMDVERLCVTKAFVGASPTLKRFKPMGHGKAFRINRRTNNITLVVKERA